MLTLASEKRSERAAQGFTAVEVLIAAAIVVAGFLAMASMFPTGYSTVTKSSNQSTGLALAQQQIECLRNMPYASIDNTASCPGENPPPGYTRTTVVQADPTINAVQVKGAKQVTVTVAMPTAGAPASRDIVLTTIIAQ